MMPKKRIQDTTRDAAEDSTEFEKRALDGTDIEQSSEDEAPEEVSTAAAAALAGQRKKVEQQARRTVAASSKSKRKRSRSSKGGGSENTEKNSYGGTEAEAEAGRGTEGLELPSELLAEVKSEGLKRTEDEAALITKSKEVEKGATPVHKGGRPIKAEKFSDIQRSDNFQLVVLDKDDSGAGEGADSKAQAAESAQNVLRMRTARHKRVNHSVFKARQRLGPSPNF